MKSDKTTGEKFIGVKLPKGAYLKFSLISIKNGRSRSAMMKKLALDLIAREDAREQRGARA